MTIDIYAHLTQQDYDNEIWKDINGYQGLYQVSNMGRVKSLERFFMGGTDYKQKVIVKERILKPGIGKTKKDAYPKVVLYKNSKGESVAVHLLVARHFLDNPENLPEVNHKTGVKHFNRAVDLEYVTKSDNAKHAFDTGLSDANKAMVSNLQTGENNRMAKLSDFQVAQIRVFLKRDFSGNEIAGMFGVKPSLISHIKSGKVRTRLTPT